MDKSWQPKLSLLCESNNLKKFDGNIVCSLSCVEDLINLSLVNLTLHKIHVIRCC